MTNTVSYADEYLYWDNPEAVTVKLRRFDEETPIEVSIAFREDLNRDRAAYLGIQISGDATVWNIPAALLEGNELEEDDLITDADGVIWQIKSLKAVRVGSSLSHWWAACVKQKTSTV